ncbi:uncharacterized protein [Halyomorpha halys]|uniref:uncharacterized protein n=1 Tax=Halyomorpha halys TaxID=286706 RepID=UPI0006D51BDC
MESTKIYVAEIKLLQKNLKEQNCRESRRIKEKNGNIPILRIQDISLSDDDDDNLRTPVRRSRSAGCHPKFSDSDDQSFLLPVSRKKVTSKKKKRRQEAKDLESPYYFDGRTDSSSTSTGHSTRRRLYKKTSEELTVPSDSFCGDNTQASPNTIFRTLRTGKKY